MGDTMRDAVRQVDAGLFRGPRPETQADVAWLNRTFAVERVLNLQGLVIEAAQVAEEAGWAKAIGVEFVHDPWNWLTPPGADRIRVALGLAKIGYGAVYVHCHDGVDRTGVLCAAWRVRRGRTFGAAVGELIDDGFHLDRYFWWLPLLQTVLSSPGGAA